tara:strand:- start:323 stop:2002 length:1680 start_codon:yes stop_codon:yes gene_type:complete
MVDQATWKHADLAFDLNAGQLPSPTELAALAWNGFNFHQVAFIPYSLCFALFSLVLGSSYFSLHLFATGFGALGVAGWSLLLARCGPRHSAAAFAVICALAPLPAAMMQVRPYSGHSEAQGLATLAVALLLCGGPRPLSGSFGRLLLTGALAGAALSLSPLAAPLLIAGCCAALPSLVGSGASSQSFRSRLGPTALGLSLGLSPYLVRGLFAPTSMLNMPVIEYDQADPVSILRGLAGPDLAATFSRPFHLILNAESISQAHSYQGLSGGDSTLGNLVVGVATLLCLCTAATSRLPERRSLSLLLAVGPWTTLAIIAVAGPDLCLRYLTGIYPMAMAAFAFCLGLALERSHASIWSITLRVCCGLCAATALLSWTGSGSRDLISHFEPQRFAQALRYAPGSLLSSTGMRAMPPVYLWDETSAFLAARRGEQGWQASGFDLPFLPLDDMSTQGWQPFPEIDAALVANRARLSGEGASLRLRNMGWALAAACLWRAERFEQLLAAVEDPACLRELRAGAAEGARSRNMIWPDREAPRDESRMEPRPAPTGTTPTEEEQQTP